MLGASPPEAPRDAWLRMKTPSSSACDPMRMRSPRSAPPVYGLDGSTASTATVSFRDRISGISAATSVLLPAPGGPVTAIRRGRLPARRRGRHHRATPASPRSARVSARASARRSPAAIRVRRSVVVIRARSS